MQNPQSRKADEYLQKFQVLEGSQYDRERQVEIHNAERSHVRVVKLHPQLMHLPWPDMGGVTELTAMLQIKMSHIKASRQRKRIL